MEIRKDHFGANLFSCIWNGYEERKDYLWSLIFGCLILLGIYFLEVKFFTWHGLFEMINTFSAKIWLLPLLLIMWIITIFGILLIFFPFVKIITTGILNLFDGEVFNNSESFKRGLIMIIAFILYGVLYISMLLVLTSLFKVPSIIFGIWFMLAGITYGVTHEKY